MPPGLSGFELLAKIRGSTPQLLSRVIVLTAVSTSRLQTFEFARLVWCVIRKPFELADRGTGGSRGRANHRQHGDPRFDP
jgi:hypothetical protein